MLSKDVKWPDSGEIDIMEAVGYDQNRVHSTIHCKKYNGMLGTQKGGSMMVPGADKDFHVYACEWTPTEIKFFVDGKVIFTYAETGSSDTWPFTTPFNLKLNLA